MSSIPSAGGFSTAQCGDDKGLKDQTEKEDPLPTDFTHMPISPETFLNRLACGFGRVVLFLRQNDAAPFREAILDSCLYDRTFDQQAEGYRTEYLLDIMQATGEAEFYAARIREALGADGEDYSYGQLYELAARLARNGDEEARRVMYDRFARNAAHQDTTGAADLVALDGLGGYLFVAEQWQRCPLSEEDHWEEAWLLEELERQIGREEARQALNHASEERPELADYLADVEQKRARWHNWRDSRKPLPVPTYDDLQTLIAAPKQTTRWQRWRHWAKRLDEETFVRLAQDLLAETDRVPLLKRLHMFRERAFPVQMDRLLDLARGQDEEVGEAARWALGSLTDPHVRALALELCESETPPPEALHLLRNNFTPGDYARVERMVNQEMATDEFHALSILARDLIKANSSPEAVPTLLALYEGGRCALCRGSVVGLLLSLEPLPPWMAAEGRYDADSETRALVSPR